MEHSGRVPQTACVYPGRGWWDLNPSIPLMAAHPPQEALKAACSQALREVDAKGTELGHVNEHVLQELHVVYCKLAHQRTMCSTADSAQRKPSISTTEDGQSSESNSSGESDLDDVVVERYFETTSIFGGKIKSRLAAKLRKIERLFGKHDLTAVAPALPDGSENSNTQERPSVAASGGCDAGSPVEKANSKANEEGPGMRAGPRHDYFPSTEATAARAAVSKVVWSNSARPCQIDKATGVTQLLQRWSQAHAPVFRQAPELPKQPGAATRNQTASIKWRQVKRDDTDRDRAWRRAMTLGRDVGDPLVEAGEGGASSVKPQAWINHQLELSHDQAEKDTSTQGSTDRQQPCTQVRKFSSAAFHTTATRNFSPAFSASKEAMEREIAEAARMMEEEEDVEDHRP